MYFLPSNNCAFRVGARLNFFSRAPLGIHKPLDKQPNRRGIPYRILKKANKKFRTVLNLKPFNRFVNLQKIQNEDCKICPKINRKGGRVMTTVDLKEAYYHVPIHQSFQKFLRFPVPLGSRVEHFQFVLSLLRYLLCSLYF